MGARSPILRAVCGVLALAVAGTPAACGAGPDVSAPLRVPVAVDTDLGADDIVALLYLLGRRDVDVVAVTVVGDGLVRCPVGGVHARAVLAAAGRPDIPVACGTDRPLAGTAAFPSSWRDRSDALYGMTGWRAPAGPAAAADPVALLTDAAHDHPGLPVGEHAVVAGNPDATAVTALGPLAVR